MTLRTKLLLVACSVLVLPWAGWQFVRQMEGLLREGREQALLASAEAMVRGLAVGAMPPAAPTLFVQPLEEWPRLDGDAGDWRGPLTPMRRFGERLELSLGRVEDSLLLHARVQVASQQRADAHWPMAGERDHFLLQLSGPHGEQALRLANAMSGPLIVTAADGSPPALSPQGQWRDLDDGYAIELRLPQGYRVEALGLSFVDVDSQGGARRYGTGADSPARPWPLVQREARYERALAPLVPPGMRARLLDAEGWMLAEAGALLAPPPADTVGEDEALLPAAPAHGLPWWRRQLYRWLIMADDAVADPTAGAIRSEAEEVWQALSGIPGATWRRDPAGQRQLLSAAVPVRLGGEVRGALLLEREDDAALLLTDRAVGGLLLVSLLALLASGGLVFVFASRLSGRIRRLRDATENALDREGRLTPFPRVAAKDEIGDLSRSFGRLLDEVAANTEYLRSLAGKLSHELNTPLAIVRTSLENLQPGDVADDAQPYLERARSGVDRLGALVRAMSEASRIEHAIAAAEGEDFDLRALLVDCAGGYRDLLGGRALELQLPAAPARFHGAPDLIVQALDKLIDNAAGFCPEGGWVRLRLESEEGALRVHVANQGPRLPASMRHRLFDSLVSLRDRAGGPVHLGLGLYVVRLVCEVHRGHAEAADLPTGEGVEFTLHLRGMPRSA